MTPSEYFRRACDEQPSEPSLVAQEHGEPYDLFAIKAFVISLRHCSDEEVRATIRYIADRGFAELLKRKLDRSFPNRHEPPAAQQSGQEKE